MSFRETKENEGIGPYQPELSIILIRLEDCFIFKDWVEKLFKEGNITLSKSVLVDPLPTNQCHSDGNRRREDPFWGQFP